jgi:anti-sigma regulatory factor (Ser/Thr protein kinase)
MSSFERTIRLPRRGGIVGFQQYLDFAEEIERFEGPSAVIIDLSDVAFAHPSGMAPLVATIRYLHENGWEIDVWLPRSEFLCDYFAKAGWISGVTGDAVDRRVHGTTFIPLTDYSSSEELNPILDDTLLHFARHAVFEAGVLDGLEWALNEIAGNVLDHAGGVSGWLQVAEQPKKGLIEVVVVDCGRGICASMRERFSDLKDDLGAVARAVEKGTTRDPEVGQGNGLAGSLRLAILGGGYANVYSGQGLVRYMPRTQTSRDRGVGLSPTGGAQNLVQAQVAQHHGTVVSLTLSTRQSLDVARALWGRHPGSLTLEKRYVPADDTSNAIVFNVAQEASGLGNRASARPVRSALHNALNAFPEDRVHVDFRDVNLASASFLDEFLARLAKDVGVDTFFRRVALINMNDLVRTSINAVLEQRLGI